MMAQSAHAATAILARTWDRADTQSYIAPDNLEFMHKIVLQTPKNVSLAKLSEQLRDAELQTDIPPHFLWIEEPEHIPTCLAIAPNCKPESLVQILKKCTLVRS